MKRRRGLHPGQRQQQQRAAAVAHWLGLCDREISVHMPGGIIEIEIGDDHAIRMTVAVAELAGGVISKEKFSAPIAA